VSAITVKNNGYRIDLVDESWPQTCEFSGMLLKSRPERVRFHDGLVDLRFDNGRAVYRITDYRFMVDTYETELVYCEGPS
jgi:hypothetical protein